MDKSPEQAPTSCKLFVRELVAIARDCNVWHYGPDINQRMRAGIRIADRFLPHDHLAHKLLGSSVSPEKNTAMHDVSGFREELIAGDQGTEALRHIGAAIACVLQSCSFLIHMQNPSDSKQLRQENSAEKIEERKAELADNEAGRQAGLKIRDFMNEAISLEELETELLHLFCR